MASTNIHSQKILILDFGSQYTQLIARRIREVGVFCEIWDYDVSEVDFAAFAPQGIVFSVHRPWRRIRRSQLKSKNPACKRSPTPIGLGAGTPHSKSPGGPPGSQPLPHLRERGATLHRTD